MVQGDTDFEENEEFTVTLSNPSDGAMSITQATAKGTIQNDDEPPVRELSISALSANKLEGDSDSTEFTFQVFSSDETTLASTVTWTITPNDADGVDRRRFRLRSGEDRHCDVRGRR